MSLLFPCAAQRITGAALIRLYYKPVSGKKKVSFAKFGKFTINFLQPPQRRRREARKGEQHLRPEGPQRAKKPRAEREVAHRAKKRRAEHIEAQLAPADAQREEKRQERERRAVEEIERAREAPPRCPPQPHGAQQVIEERENEAEQERSEKAPRLLGERHAHGASTPEQAREQAAAA